HHAVALDVVNELLKFLVWHDVRIQLLREDVPQVELPNPDPDHHGAAPCMVIRSDFGRRAGNGLMLILWAPIDLWLPLRTWAPDRVRLARRAWAPPIFWTFEDCLGTV